MSVRSLVQHTVIDYYNITRDDDDAFLYGETSATVQHSVSQPVPVDPVNPSNGILDDLEEKLEEEPPFGLPSSEEEHEVDDQNGAQEEEESEQDEDEDDIEIIMEPTSRSLDFRQQNAAGRTIQPRPTTQPSKPQPSQLTTEYTPHERGAPPKLTQPPFSSVPPAASLATDIRIDEGPDPSTLPPATAPPSYPSINPELPGVLDGRSILEVDLNAMAEKPWRRPGSDISDWFNYGFDEISWETYCYRRRDLGDLANVLKTNVINFAAMSEDQLTALPPDLRTMVMTGANAMMNANAGANMMGANVGMNPMMDMSGMGAMNMSMGMGMNGDLGLQMQAGGPMMQEGPGPGSVGPVNVGPVVTNGTPEQGVQMGMQDGFGGGPGPGMMSMGMGAEYGIQQEQGPMGQGMYGGMDGSTTPVTVPVQTPVQGPTPTPGHAGRGAPPVQFRGRAMAQGLRGRGGFVGRGRGRYDGPPTGPARPASPLPPGVPTGPRNQNRYKDRDGNAPAVEGLDYGGTAKDGGGTRTPSGEPEDRLHSRKRRISPGLDDTRGSKRR